MTTHRYRRCQHCQTTYTFQGSGFGAPKYNDYDHCPDCKKAIVEALAAIPRKFEKVLVPTDEKNALELQALQEAGYQDKTKGRGSLLTEPLPQGALPIYDKEPSVVSEDGSSALIQARRVEVGLTDMVDPSNKDKRGRVRVDGQMYHWNYWTKDPEGTSLVRVEMERDLTTGEEVPWRDFR